MICDKLALRQKTCCYCLLWNKKIVTFVFLILNIIKVLFLFLFLYSFLNVNDITLWNHVFMAYNIHALLKNHMNCPIVSLSLKAWTVLSSTC